MPRLPLRFLSLGFPRWGYPHVRYLCLLVVSGLALAVLPASAQAAPPTHNRADAAAGWLARQMVDGDHFEARFGGFTFPDQGLTIDAVLAFAATKTADSFGAAAAVWLAQPEILAGYLGDGVTESYAGPLAKLSLAAQVRGLNPASFGGVDLPAQLRHRLTPSGRLSDLSAYGDFSNAFSQSLAIIALHRTPGGAPTSAVDFLVASQCADGGFPLLFAQPTCTSDVDSTAMVVQALLAVHRFAPAAGALHWLVDVQLPSGGFAAGTGTGTPNANSTGLAAAALAVGLHPVAFLKARSFLTGLQVGCTGPPADRGAVAYDTSGFDPGTAPRATAQAILGLTGTSLGRLQAFGAEPEAPKLACGP